MEVKNNKANNKRTLAIVIPVVVILLISLLFCMVTLNETKTLSKYFDDKTTYTALLKQVNDQKAINNKLEKVLNNKKYTFDEPFIENNPYQISPLSAIIIFTTEKAEEIKLYINDNYCTTLEATTKHVIPVYGLYEDYENVIKLEMGERSATHIIKTEASHLEYPLNVEYVSENINREQIYFTVASYATYLTGWDVEGKLRFYLTVDNRMDVEWLDNGHFIIGTSQGQFAENFLAFVEMDYLGKIYNYYTMENGFSFESQILSNGNIMAAGGVKPVYVTEQVIYEMNPKDGKKVSDINITKLVTDIDPNFNPAVLGQKAIRNGFYYNETTGELVLSFRGWDTVLSVNYKNKELNWIFTDPANELFTSPVWDKYKVTLESGRYPLGEHSTKITKEGYIAFFNNGYNRYHGFENGGNDNETSYLENYSSGEVYEIKDKKARLVWNYDADKKLFSHQYGSISIDENNYKLIDFGYCTHDDYRQDPNGLLSISEKNPDHIFASIIELDNDYNVIFKATSEEGKYRAFKHNLYNKTTNNVNIKQLNIYDSVPFDELRKDNSTNINLDSAVEWINTFDITQHTFTTDYDIKSDDSIDIYYVNEVGKMFILNYKEKESKSPFAKRIFNAKLGPGKYAVFIKVNDILYNTKSVIIYE